MHSVPGWLLGMLEGPMGYGTSRRRLGLLMSGIVVEASRCRSLWASLLWHLSLTRTSWHVEVGARDLLHRSTEDGPTRGRKRVLESTGSSPSNLATGFARFGQQLSDRI